jgi:hypothetical protein
MRTRSVVLILLVLLMVASNCGAPRLQTEFPFVAATPYPTQHGDPRRSDYVDLPAPLEVTKAWEAITDSTIIQPCVTGPTGLLYCARAFDLGQDKCNLVALDELTGAVVWEDRVNGQCLLDHGTHLATPLVDRDGNVYASDTRQVVSFTADGVLRWTNGTPATLPSVKGSPNPPFGLNLLPTGELVTATLGDAHFLAFDRATGNLLGQFDLPSEKIDNSTPRPPGFLDPLGGPMALDLFWKWSLGAGEFENDNDIAVDTRTGLIFMSGGAPAPNPTNAGALWAVRYNDGAFEVAFVVPFTGAPGGISTSPTITKDGQFVLIGDNTTFLVAVDLPTCAALPAGSACSAFASINLFDQLRASLAVTPDNRIITRRSATTAVAIDVGRDEDDQVTLTEAWATPIPNNQRITGVIGIFDGVAYAPTSSFAFGTHELTAYDVETGAVLATIPTGDLANVTMASDQRVLIGNELNFIDELFARKNPAGVEGFFPVDQLISGDALLVEHPNVPSGRVEATSVDFRIAVPASGGPGDPVAHGAVFVLYNPLTGQKAQASLPSAGWSPQPSGIVFDDPSAVCTHARVKDSFLSVRCDAAGLGFSLDQATQGTLGVALVLGSDAPYCAVFGGDVIQDEPEGFAAYRAPMPGRCDLP